MKKTIFTLFTLLSFSSFSAELTEARCSGSSKTLGIFSISVKVDVDDYCSEQLNPEVKLVYSNSGESYRAPGSYARNDANEVTTTSEDMVLTYPLIDLAGFAKGKVSFDALKETDEATLEVNCFIPQYHIQCR